MRIVVPAVPVLTVLQVVSEDTVLYTIRKYLSGLEQEALLSDEEEEEEQQQQHAKQRLAPLIRCPHLSRYWLSGLLNSDEAGEVLLPEMRPLLKRLLLFRDAHAGCAVTSTDLQEGGLLEGAPASWALGSRVSKSVSSVQMVSQVDVSELRDAARRSAAEKDVTLLRCPGESPPLGGVDFGVTLYIEWKEQGVEVGLFCTPRNLPGDMFYMSRFRVVVEDFNTMAFVMVKPVCGNDMRGWGDYFDLGPMVGGWDEVAWARKGLPTSGQLTIKLTVSKGSLR
jgi:hypothetical protein